MPKTLPETFLRSLFIGFLMSAILMQPSGGSGRTLFDFTQTENVKNWMEQSDTVRTVGKSKAVLALQTTQMFRRAIFFTLLNPQPNGAGFAGMITATSLDLSNYQKFDIRCRGQGSNSHYKVLLRQWGMDPTLDVTYEQLFTAPMSSEEFSNVVLPFAEFKPFYRGREVPDAEPLDTSNITSFGLQIYGGVYSPIKQSGVSALEIETISVT
ncbi:uncharacterized protein C9E9.15 [Orussus abietinus]|uniref:uncharacterized protein C9E9.15 n=1 Tax=Orussus abietinus TaxID=222816 RepID=UPI000626AF9C|nr:uncharacterized protein C9E9.15 [Orussus abietinus]XP_012281124.1 uncharacterized protein C9E9.15 [Orussus abietinus]XP_012281133.1 uncharacterized protein C9E9.15 [Orussus abietinus]XP_012281141.1 uncharacterized protein C9E9.15 [Orussus abietinus]XP_012281150.1 uncharacterized protein C9E9.15 [Orussus abietinus]XP_012281158.1 uncharacterized protein C9E9.15 [Orussus abietinus]